MIRLQQKGITVQSKYVTLTTVPEEEDSASPWVELGSILAASCRSDRPDGLFATVVVDRDGVALGLVYSSVESIRCAIREGKGIYYSRSRGGLWRKGDTSGAWQKLYRVDVDCDDDALRFVVHQNGSPPAFCHLGTRSCWGETLKGMKHLEQTLNERRVSAPEKSYTKRLFEDGDLLRNKLLEEGQELIEATEPDHVAAEFADVVYFAMVKLVQGGASLADVERHLDSRSLKVTRRPGNAKAYRIAAAEELLKTGNFVF
jgi:phosphoribosyl-ATP pyrophosphohydrolase/phosphoribosyl-AMP cyclohydrolase/histidinol dehydrogenase